MSTARPQTTRSSRTTAVVAKLVATIAATFAFAAFGSKPAHPPHSWSDGARAAAGDHARNLPSTKDRP